MPTNPRDTYRGQSRSTNMVPFDVRHCFLLVCYSNFVPKTRRFSDIRLQKISWHWNPGQRSLKVIGTDTDRSATMLHNNQGPISYRFRDKRRFRSKIAKISHPPRTLCSWWRGSPWNWIPALGVKNLNDGATGPRKKFDDIFSRVDTIHHFYHCDRQMVRQKNRHRTTAKTGLTHSVAR